MIIDGHAHACGPFLTADCIESTIKKNNVDMVLLTPGQRNSKTTYRMKNYAARHPYEDVLRPTNRKVKIMIGVLGAIKQIPAGNDDVYQLKKSMPDNVRQMYWVTSQNQAQLEQDYELMRFDRVKLHQCWEYFDIKSRWFYETAAWTEEKNLPLFIHMYSQNDVKQMITYIKEHKNLKVIVAHLFGMEQFLEEQLSGLENVYFDLSNCFFVSKERIMKAYEHFGAEKLLFGSDTPYGIDAQGQTKELIESLPLTDFEKEKILGENLWFLLNI